MSMFRNLLTGVTIGGMLILPYAAYAASGGISIAKGSVSFEPNTFNVGTAVRAYIQIVNEGSLDAQRTVVFSVNDREQGKQTVLVRKKKGTSDIWFDWTPTTYGDAMIRFVVTQSEKTSTNDDVYEQSQFIDEDFDNDGVQRSKDLDDDNDGLPDAWEEQFGMDTRRIDASDDADGDGLSNLEEYKRGTSPSKTDSDGDGLSDGDEVKRGTDPSKTDSDGDGLSDGNEVKRGTDPMKTDSDSDGLSDGNEVKRGTDPMKTDSDGDGIPDKDDPAPTGGKATAIQSINLAIKKGMSELSEKMYSRRDVMPYIFGGVLGIALVLAFVKVAGHKDESREE